ncbi:MAG TPA: DNA mismatch repair endonuclease MutL [Candidatus Sumerlaeota bacterium]|nr:DNA mismatch repair endonuclease MutL [Candidatus Sumerlaeota bacterium]
MSDPPVAAAAPATAPIARLPTRLINQIAAGEVVTRPAAALKELVENSLDAGAGRIEVSVEEDALSFSVRDDGLGMAADDLVLAVERYATSKIRELDDLQRLTTRGFRGEALAAIAAVSRLEIVTRTPDALEGLRLRVSGGQASPPEPCAANPGTTIAVRDLFFNTPARLKFLRAAVAEWGHMLQAFVRQSLTRPDVAFSIRWRGRPYLDLPAGQSIRDRLAQVLPTGAGQDLLSLDLTLHEVRVTGAVTGPRTTRRDRRHQYAFVNGRPIVFRPLMFALEEAYRGLIMTQRYPMAAVMLTLPGELVDVNVHPTKEQVRFRNEALVAGAVHRAVLEALRAADLVPRLQMPPPGAGLKLAAPPMPKDGTRPATRTAAPAPPLRLDQPDLTDASRDGAQPGDQLDFIPGFGLPGESQGTEGTNPPPSPPPPSNTPAGPAPVPYAEPVARDEASLLERLRRLPHPPRMLGQVAETYLLAEAGAEGMLVIDQHAAHEKILYLRYLRAAVRPDGIQVQPLMIPHSIDLAPEDEPALETLRPALAEAGFELEPFGGRTWLVQAIPVLFDRLDVPAFLRDLIDDVGQGDLPREMRRLRERICARAACRAAVKAGDRLAPEEMQRLLHDLLGTADALRCPHGRPTLLLLTRDQLDRQFGRLG